MFLVGVRQWYASNTGRSTNYFEKFCDFINKFCTILTKCGHEIREKLFVVGIKNPLKVNSIYTVPLNCVFLYFFFFAAHPISKLYNVYGCTLQLLFFNKTLKHEIFLDFFLT